MAYDSDLEALLDQATRTWSGVQKKKMFGGLVYTTGGNICVGIWRDRLIIRAGEAAEGLMAADDRYRPFDVTGRAMKGWTMLSPSGWRDAETRRHAIASARAFCRTLPDKT